MKRYLAIFGFVFIGVIAGLIVRGLPIVLQVNAGGGIPQADRNGDVNGDARLDMSDAVYLLLHIFRDGPQPVAFAQGLPDNAEQLLEEIANPCKERSDRYVRNGDGTTTDTCTGLMWFETTADVTGDGQVMRGNQGEQFQDWLSWEGALQFCQDLQFAGYDDWRLPTAEELVSLHQGGLRREAPDDLRASPWPRGINPSIEPFTGSWDTHWTATEKVTNPLNAWTWEPAAGTHRFSTAPKDILYLVLPVRTAQ